MELIDKEQDNRIAAMQQVIKKLRHEDLRHGHCFMIFDDELPEGQAYYEYPDGTIQVEQLEINNFELPRIVVKVLTNDEVAIVKQKHEVFR